MLGEVSARLICLAIVACLAHAAPAAAESLSVASKINFSGVDDPGGENYAGAVRGPKLRGGMDYVLEDGGGTFAFYDGRGSLRGTVSYTTEPSGDQTRIEAVHKVERATGRFYGAKGRFRLIAKTSNHVPAVTVFKGELAGKLRSVEPKRVRKGSREALRISMQTEETKVDFESPDPRGEGNAQLTVACRLTKSNIGPGVWVHDRTIKPGDDVPTRFTFFGPTGTLKGSAVLKRNTDEGETLTVTSGTRRFRGLTGTLDYKPNGQPGQTSGYYPVSVSGRLN